MRLFSTLIFADGRYGRKPFFALTYDEREDEAVKDKLCSAHSYWSFLKGKHMMHFN